MSWGRLDDGFHRHPKVRRLSLAARGLWATALSWVADNELDGHIPADMVPKLAEGEPCEALVDELTRVTTPYDSGLWERNGNGFVIHDYLQFNPAAADLAKKRKRRVKATTKWRAKRDQVLTGQQPITAVPPGSGRDGTGSSSSSVRKGGGVGEDEPPRHRNVRLPDPLPIPLRWKAWAEKGIDPVDVPEVFTGFKTWHWARGTRRDDWYRSWQEWCRRHVKFEARDAQRTLLR